MVMLKQIFLVKKGENTYGLQANGSSATPFELLFQGSSLGVKKLSAEGYIAYGLLKEKPFPKISDSTNQIVSQFHVNYPIFYKAKNKVSIKVYEYPAFEAKTNKVFFRRGNKIEEKWESGFYKKSYHPIKDKTWIAAVCGSKFIGWLLLSDVEADFVKVKE